MDSSDREHSYPPQSTIASELPHNPRSSPRIIQRFSKAFCFRRKRINHHTPYDSESPHTSEFGSTTLTSTISRGSSRPTSHRLFRPRSNKGPDKPPPPLIVPSWRYKAAVQTFNVRSETEFSVTCTIIQPRSRFHFKWPLRLRFGFRIPGRRSNSGHANGRKANKKSRRKSHGGVAVEQDVCDDSWSIIQPQCHSRPESQSLQEKRAKTVRRNSGWAGIFSTSEPHSSTNTGTNGNGAYSSRDNEEGSSFEIDRVNGMLVVPDVNIGVEYSVKQEVENCQEEVRLVGTSTEDYDSPRFRYSEDSWLEL